MKKILKKIFNPLRWGIIVYSKGIQKHEHKFVYQKRFIDFDISHGARVLDVGSGGEPFPYATHLVDKYPHETSHRYNPLKTDNIPFTQGDVENIPFPDKSFDFVYCAHVLEHIENPARACEELMRVGKRGYIEIPTRMSDVIFNFVKLPDFHKWYIIRVNNTLIFHEYTPSECVDTQMNEIFFMMHSITGNPLRKAYRKHKNLFTHMFLWENRFNYYVFDKNGNLTHANNEKSN